MTDETWMGRIALALMACLLLASFTANPHPGLSRIRIIHFDVNVGDATLFISPEGRGVLIDGGDTGRGNNPIRMWMDQARDDGILESLEFTIATHYDGDHIGGLDEILVSDWHPTQAVLDRCNTLLPPFSSDKFNSTHHTSSFDLTETEMENLIPWASSLQEAARTAGVHESARAPWNAMRVCKNMYVRTHKGGILRDVGRADDALQENLR